MIPPGVFFLFFSSFWNFHFLDVRGIKGKNIPKWKITITSITHHISQEQHSIWSWFFVHLCKIMIPPGFALFCLFVFFLFFFVVVVVFHFFEISIFRANRGGKRVKISQNENNNYIRLEPHLWNSIADDHDFWYTCVRWWYLQGFFSFLIFSFFGLLGG